MQHLPFVVSIMAALLWVVVFKLSCKRLGIPWPSRFQQREGALRRSSGWVDRSTGERGVMLSASSIKWSFGDRVEVDGGFYCGHLCGSGGVYEVMKSRGHWKVESYRKRWDS
jgi:hypothetical protein